MYELIRDSKPPRQPKKEKRAAARDLERITQVLLEALRASGYLNQRPSAIADEKVRRLIRRLNLSAKDAAIFPGMLRQIVWKLQPR